MVTTRPLQVHPGNLGQLRAWDGGEGQYWAAHCDAFERSVAGYDTAFFDAAAIAATDRVLDVGCGCGGTARAAARRASRGLVVGVDLSSAMLAEAHRQAEQDGLRNVTFLQADAQVHPFEPASFDVAIGRTAAMFFSDRVAALSNLRAALLPHGRLVLLVWQAPRHNEWFLELTGALTAGRRLPGPPPDVPHPFTMADPTETGGVLSAAGYTDVVVREARAPMWFGADADRAYGFTLGLLGWMLDGLDPAGRDQAQRALRSTIETHTGPPASPSAPRPGSSPPAPAKGRAHRKGKSVHEAAAPAAVKPSG
jgi:SAM-dependent methyltransferase